MSAWIWVAGTILVLATLLVGFLLYTRYRIDKWVKDQKLEQELTRRELVRVEQRLNSERSFELGIHNDTIIYDITMNQFRFTREFEQWCDANISHKLDIEVYSGITYLFLPDEYEAFAFKMRWG